MKLTFALSVSMPQSSGHCNIHQLEMIQRKAAGFVFSDYSRYLSVSAMPNELY